MWADVAARTRRNPKKMRRNFRESVSFLEIGSMICFQGSPEQNTRHWRAQEREISDSIANKVCTLRDCDVVLVLATTVAFIEHQHSMRARNLST